MANSVLKMRELCEITSSKRIFAADYKEEGVPFYRGKEISEKYRGKVDVSTELFIDRGKFEQIRTKFGAPIPGDLLLTSVGTLGSPYVVNVGEEFYFKDGNLTWFRNFKNLDSRFLYYWLQSPQGRAELKKSTIGSSQPAYTIVLLKEMEISLPPLPTQRKIASILSAYDDLIENNLRRIKILEEMAQALYREWFVKFRFPGHEKVRMVDSPLGKIPEGWEIRRAIDGIEMGPKTQISKEGLKTFVPMNGLANGSMNVEAVEKRAGNSGTKFRNGDTLFARITPCLENGKIGFVQVGLGSTEFIVLRSKTLIPEYVYLMARSDEFRENAIQSMTGASGRQRVQNACFKHFLFAHPNKETIRAFSDQIPPIFKTVHIMALKNNNLRQTRDLILPKLISGELDVSELDISIPEEAA